MNTAIFKTAFLATAALLLAQPVAAVEDEEEAKDLQTYSTSDRRSPIEHEKVEIERPKFDNAFTFEASKPSMSGMQIAKPQFQILEGPGPVEETTPQPSAPVQAPAKTATPGGGAAPSVGSTGGVTRSIQPLKMDPPEYPRDALRRREEGHVVVEFTINTQGETEDISVVESRPRGSFDTEARRAVARWKFSPALKDGRPVSQRIRHTLEFSLTGK